MNNVFLGSFDPFHQGHLNTWAIAEQEIGPTGIVVCNNGLKEQGWLTLQQRRRDIIYTLLISPGFDAQKRDPESMVAIAQNHDDIRSIIISAERVVRGIRDQADALYINKLLDFYELHGEEEKGYVVQVPDGLKNISSTTNKIVLQTVLDHFDSVPLLYRKVFGEDVYKRLQSMEFSRQSRVIDQETKKYIEKAIFTYFSKIATL